MPQALLMYWSIASASLSSLSFNSAISYITSIHELMLGYWRFMPLKTVSRRAVEISLKKTMSTMVGSFLEIKNWRSYNMELTRFKMSPKSSFFAASISSPVYSSWPRIFGPTMTLISRYTHGLITDRNQFMCYSIFAACSLGM